LKADSEEPAPEVARSGACVVGVCSSVDMGDYTFRLYSKSLPLKLRYIPKESCRCKSIKPIAQQRDYITFSSVELSGGQAAQRISVVNVGPRHHERATYETFKEKQSQLSEVTDFHPDGDQLARFRVYRSNALSGASKYDYFLIPRNEEFSFKGKSQPIAFSVPNGVYVGSPLKDFRPRDIKFAATVRLYDNIHFFQFFYPQLTPSDRWIELLQLSAELADSRLFRK
jgi:hypothetical protein